MRGVLLKLIGGLNIMKKDLTLYSGSPLSRLYGLGRFGDIFSEIDKIWKDWDFDMKFLNLYWGCPNGCRHSKWI